MKMKAKVRYTLWTRKPDSLGLVPKKKTKTVRFEGDAWDAWTGFEKARAEFHRQVEPAEGERIDGINITLIDDEGDAR